MLKPSPALAPPATPTIWEPALTRVFVLGLAFFAGKTEPDWAVENRLDEAFAALLIARGVPAEQVLLLQDSDATTAALQTRFAAFLKQSHPGELLIFYVASHGTYDANEGSHALATYDGELPCAWVLDTIEAHFKGARALLLVDCCYSGGLVELAAARRGAIAYAGLSSNAAHNVACGDWRFIACVLRGFRGEPGVDLDGDGCITLAELARFTARQLAFISEEKSTFLTSPGFGPLAIAATQGTLKDARIGQLVEVLDEGDWYKAEILDTLGAKLKVHYTDFGSDSDEWVPTERMRLHHFTRFAPGTAVELFAEDEDRWCTGHVLDSYESLHLARYDDYAPAYDEWFGPSRIRQPLSRRERDVPGAVQALGTGRGK